MPGAWNRQQRQIPQQRRRQVPPRWVTGSLLGVILSLVLGCFIPLLAQPDWPDSPVDQPLEQTRRDLTARAVASPLPEDIDGDWAADCIRQLVAHQLILPEAPGAWQFQPQAPLTWAVLSDWLNRSFPTAGAYAGASAAEQALGLASPVTMLHAYPSHYYRPQRPLTRAEALTAMAAKLALPYVARAHALLQASLVDGEQVPDYGREGVAATLAAGILVNYPDPQRVQAHEIMTRGAMAAMICRARSESDLRAAVAPDWIARPQPLPAPLLPDPELRGVWLTNIDSEVLFSRQNLAAAIQRLQALHINTLYPVVWNFGYSQFPSATGERVLGRRQRLWPGENPAFEATQRDRDMLQELIDLAHAAGMAVIPWFEFGFMAPADYALLEAHPDWFTQRQDGSRTIQQGADTFTWMNPFHPRSQQLLLQLMAEVLDRYPVEGIQVDDHLGLPVDMGYDPYTQQRYARDHGGELPPQDDTDPEWMRWRADQITEFMTLVKRLIEQRRPQAILSVSPSPYPFAYARYLQDWPSWVAAGLVDELIIQVYRSELDPFVWELNQPATVMARRKVPTSIGLLSGLRGRPTAVALLTEQLAALRDRAYAGVSYFFYETLWTPASETAAERQRQLQQSLARPAARPRVDS